MTARLVAVGKAGPAFRHTAANAWILALAANGSSIERAHAASILAALPPCTAVLDPRARRWLERIANYGDSIKRSWASAVLLQLSRGGTECQNPH